MKVIVHEMKYIGDNISLNIELPNYSDKHYDEYKKLSCEAFRELSIKTKRDPDEFFTRDEMIERSENIYLLFNNDELIASVELNNIIDHFFVNKKYQKMGYGMILLKFAINKLYEKNNGNIRLFVADINTKALNFYMKNNFEIVNSVEEEW